MFANREEAGAKLAEKLLTNQVGEELADVIVLGVPRGGVVVAARVAAKLGCPLDVIICRKIRAPGNAELAIGAIGTTSNSRILNQQLIEQLAVSSEYLDKEIAFQQEQIQQREKLYRQGRKPVAVEGKTVILVDDGAATGATLIASARQIWVSRPKRLIIALPVAPADTVKQFGNEADEVEVLEIPSPFFAVGQVYEEFGQVTDEEVITILNKAN